MINEKNQESGFKESFEELLPSIYVAVEKDYGMISNPDISLLKFSENIICLVKSGHQKYVLRVNRPGYHTPEELESELIWITEIRQQGKINTAFVYKGNNGKYLQEFVSHNKEHYTYSIQEFLEGTPIRMLEKDNLLVQMSKVGETAAILHTQSEKRSEKKADLVRFSWDIEDTLSPNARWGYYKLFPQMTEADLQMFMQAEELIKQRLEKYGRNIHNYGLIHADLHTENLLASGEKLSLIDFDDCGYSWFLYDYASAVSQLNNNIYEMTNAYLKGYESVRKLSKEDKDEIETFMILRRMVRLGWMTTRKYNGILEKEGTEYFNITKQMIKEYLRRK